ncbi:MAG: hypothetical protein IKZ58_07405 [Selenomonadaceae bacterium]|nr:hypothetical protein [Selenomonadaceae bacterium]
MKVKLQINMRDANNNSIKENIGYVNPNATDAQLYELANKFCALTTNTFVSVDKIVITELESEGE